MFINTPIDLHSHECEHSLTRSFIDMNLCVIIDTFVGTFLEFRMNTSRGTMQHSHVLNAVFLIGDREAIAGPVDKTMVVERVCILCRERLRGREWLFKSDCPKCLGEDSLKTPAEYVRFSQLTWPTSKMAAEPTSKIRKGRPIKKKRGRSAEEMRSLRDGLESRRAQGCSLSQSDATAGVAFESGVVDDAKAMADSNKSLIPGLDECLDESCAAGGGSSAAIVELGGNAECAEISGEVQVRPRISGFDDSSEEFFGDRVEGSPASPAAQARTCVSGFDDSSEEFFGGSEAGPPKGGQSGSVAGRTSRRTRRSRNNALLDRQIDESRTFQPDDVDLSLCQALRNARVQCHSAKVRGTEYCRVHQRRQYHGCVRGALPAQVLAKFRMRLLGRRGRSNRRICTADITSHEAFQE